jgi:hypothetical protein
LFEEQAPTRRRAAVPATTAVLWSIFLIMIYDSCVSVFVVFIGHLLAVHAER